MFIPNLKVFLAALRISVGNWMDVQKLYECIWTCTILVLPVTSKASGFYQTTTSAPKTHSRMKALHNQNFLTTTFLMQVSQDLKWNKATQVIQFSKVGEELHSST